MAAILHDFSFHEDSLLGSQFSFNGSRAQHLVDTREMGQILSILAEACQHLST
jgi:hypothetical protein